VRRAIQHGQESTKRLASRHAIHPKTVAKWHRRSSVEDVRMGPKQPRSTTLSMGPEAVAAAFRKHALLPLDDSLYALQATMPQLTRPALHRCYSSELMCARKDIGQRLTRPSHPRPNGRVERMNRTLKETTVRTCHCSTHARLRAHLACFINACNFAKRRKTLAGLTVFELICSCWQKEPHRFHSYPHHLSLGLNS
jgi:hypothetical protein